MTRLIIQANGTLFFFKKYIYNVLNNNSSFEIIYLLILIQSSSKIQDILQKFHCFNTHSN